MAASYDFALANHELHHVLFHQAGFGEADTFARARTLLAELIEAGQAAGELEVADPPLATEFLLHGLHGVLVAATHRPRSERRRLVAGVTELSCRRPGGQDRAVTPSGVGRCQPATWAGTARAGSSRSSGTGASATCRSGRTPAQIGRS